jgi:hypothetical protein
VGRQGHRARSLSATSGAAEQPLRIDIVLRENLL